MGACIVNDFLKHLSQIGDVMPVKVVPGVNLPIDGEISAAGQSITEGIIYHASNGWTVRRDVQQLFEYRVYRDDGAFVSFARTLPVAKTYADWGQCRYE